MKTRASGFTIIELVVVIVLLGILAATALPRFVDLSSDARSSAVKGVAGSMSSAVNLARTKRDVSSSPTATALSSTTSGFTTVLWFPATASTWPISAGGSAVVNPVTSASCRDLARTLLSNPPIASDATATSAGTGGQYRVSGATTICTYTLDANTADFFTYDNSTGAITVTTNP